MKSQGRKKKPVDSTKIPAHMKGPKGRQSAKQYRTPKLQDYEDSKEEETPASILQAPDEPIEPKL